MADPNNPFLSNSNENSESGQDPNPASQENSKQSAPSGENSSGLPQYNAPAAPNDGLPQYNAPTAPSEGVPQYNAPAAENAGFASAANSVPLPGQYGYQEAGVKADKSKLAPWVLGCGVLATLTGIFIIPPIILIPVTIILAIIAFVMDRKRPKELRRTWMKVVGLIFALIPVITLGVIMIFFAKEGALDCMKLQDSDLIEQCLNDTFNIEPVQ